MNSSQRNPNYYGMDNSSNIESHICTFVVYMYFSLIVFKDTFVHVRITIIIEITCMVMNSKYVILKVVSCKCDN